MSLPSIDNLNVILNFLAPGVIILFVRSQFLTGRVQPHSEMLLPYVTLSIIYLAVAFAIIDNIFSKEIAKNHEKAVWLIQTFVGPIIIGIILGLNVQKGWLRRFIQWWGANSVHGIPTAWDWKFGKMNEEWVIVTLKDGRHFYGLCGSESFISSTPTERDIYIEQIYDLGEKECWIERGKNGVLITTGEISTIEFWPINNQEHANEQQRKAISSSS